jgi:CheY-like chemotaxis protein
VLLIDDDMRNVFALARELEAKGMEVIKAESGSHALTWLERLEQSEPPDLIITDIMMPGWTATRPCAASAPCRVCQGCRSLR